MIVQFYFFIKFHFLACSQIWQKLPLDHDHHFGYITKLSKKTQQFFYFFKEHFEFAYQGQVQYEQHRNWR
jgi:hypothetical protein